MSDRTQVSRLTEALARKNRIDDPAVARIGLEVRTSIGFTLKAEDEVRLLLADRPGLDAFRVVWEYRLPDGAFNDIHAALLDNEPGLLDSTKAGPVRYLGTYVVKEAENDPPLFVTTWGCPDAATASTVAKGPWSGPAGAEDLFGWTFTGKFDHAKAERITSQGLSAASVI